MEYNYRDHAGNTGDSVIRTIIITSFSCDDVDISTGECEALVALYNSTDGRNRYNSGGWLQSTGVCGVRSGIICDGNGHIGRIDLSNNNLSGYIPVELNNLTALQSLILESNNISSIVDGAFSGMTELNLINLKYNQLTSLPVSIFNLSLIHI